MAATERVVDDGEVLLDDVRYRLLDAGPLRIVSIRQMPEKMVQGDSTRADQRLASEWVIADTSGGLGINESDDSAIDRFWWATCNTDTKGSITTNITPTSVACVVSTVATAAINVALVAVFQNETFVAGTPIATGGVVDLYKYDRATMLLQSQGLAVSMATTAVVTSIVEFGPYAFVACGDRHIMYNGSGNRSSMVFETSSTSSGRALTLGDYQAAKFFVVSGNQLFKFSEGTTANYIMLLDNSKNLATDDNLWVDGLTIAKHYNVTGLSVFVNNNNDPSIFVNTTEGCLILDQTNWVLANTPLQFAPSLRNGFRAVAHDGMLWYPEALSVHRYTPGSIQNIGLDRDDGLPTDHRGYITNLTPSPYHLYATVSESLRTNDYGVDGALEQDISSHESQTFGSGANKSALYFYNTMGWHLRYFDDVGTVFSNSVYLLVDDIPTLWLGTDLGLLRFRLPSGTRRLVEDSTIVYNPSDVFYSPNYTAGFAEIFKNAIVLKIRAKGIIDSGDSVKVEYALNNSNTPTLLDTCLPTNHLVGDSEAWELPFDAASGGVGFKSLRLYITINNSSTTRPVEVKFIALRFERILPPLYSWSFRMDLSRPYKGNSVNALIRHVELTSDKVTTVNFAWRAHGEAKERWVRITQMQMQTSTGDDPKQICEITASEITNLGAAVSA